MCIRDRHFIDFTADISKWKMDGDNNCLTFTSYKNGGTADISSGKIAPVSYTHLDVYKRQR